MNQIPNENQTGTRRLDVKARLLGIYLTMLVTQSSQFPISVPFAMQGHFLAGRGRGDRLFLKACTTVWRQQKNSSL